MASRHITSVSLFAIVALALISTVQAGYRLCGIYECYGTGVYCCGYNCCYYVYSHWWFWSVWALGIAIIVSVVYGCCRARRRRAANSTVVRQAQPVYGASTYAYTGPGYSGPPNSNYNPYAGQTSPASAPPYQEKPPAYMP